MRASRDVWRSAALVYDVWDALPLLNYSYPGASVTGWQRYAGGLFFVRRLAFC